MKSLTLALVSLLAWLAAAPAAAQEAPALYVVVGAEEAPSTEPSTVTVSNAETGYEDPDAPNAFERTWISTGASLLVGTRPTRDGNLAPTWLGGFDLSLQVHRWVAVGIRRFHAGMFGDERYWTLGVSPFVELTVPLLSEIELYAQVGAAIDVRIRSADVELDEPSVAPFVGIGARFRLAPLFSIAVEGVAHVPLANGLSVGESIAPDFAVTLQGGVAIAFHFE